MSVIHFSLFFFYRRVGSMMQPSSAMSGNIFEWGVIDESNDDICACREQRAVAAGGPAGIGDGRFYHAADRDHAGGRAFFDRGRFERI
jgi:hypothetical protein